MSLVYCVCKHGVYAQSWIFYNDFACCFQSRTENETPGPYLIDDFIPTVYLPETLISVLKSVMPAPMASGDWSCLPQLQFKKAVSDTEELGGASKGERNANENKRS